MKKREGEFARLPNGEKVRIVSREGDSVLVRRITPGDPRQGTSALCLVSKLKPA